MLSILLVLLITVCFCINCGDYTTCGGCVTHPSCWFAGTSKEDPSKGTCIEVDDSINIDMVNKRLSNMNKGVDIVKLVAETLYGDTPVDEGFKKFVEAVQDAYSDSGRLYSLTKSSSQCQDVQYDKGYSDDGDIIKAKDSAEDSGIINLHTEKSSDNDEGAVVVKDSTNSEVVKTNRDGRIPGRVAARRRAYSLNRASPMKDTPDGVPLSTALRDSSWRNTEMIRISKSVNVGSSSVELPEAFRIINPDSVQFDAIDDNEKGLKAAWANGWKRTLMVAKDIPRMIPRISMYSSGVCIYSSDDLADLSFNQKNLKVFEKIYELLGLHAEKWPAARDRFVQISGGKEKDCIETCLESFVKDAVHPTAVRNVVALFQQNMMNFPGTVASFLLKLTSSGIFPAVSKGDSTNHIRLDADSNGKVVYTYDRMDAMKTDIEGIVFVKFWYKCTIAFNPFEIPVDFDPSNDLDAAKFEIIPLKLALLVDDLPGFRDLVDAFSKFSLLRMHKYFGYTEMKEIKNAVDPTLEGFKVFNLVGHPSTYHMEDIAARCDGANACERCMHLKCVWKRSGKCVSKIPKKPGKNDIMEFKDCRKGNIK